MSQTDDDHIITERVLTDGPPPIEDSPEATLIEPVRFSPADLEAAARRANGGLASPEAPRSVAPRPSRLPRWVLPYMIASVTLLLVGLLMLWLESRVVGHF